MVPRPIRVNSKTELAGVLRRWLQQTNEPTIGPLGTFAGKAWIHLDLRTGHVVLNADTKREAITDYLKDVSRRGAETPWHVVRNRRGRTNKVVYATDNAVAPGWYCYLVDERPAGAEL